MIAGFSIEKSWIESFPFYHLLPSTFPTAVRNNQENGRCIKKRLVRDPAFVLFECYNVFFVFLFFRSNIHTIVRTAIASMP